MDKDFERTAVQNHGDNKFEDNVVFGKNAVVELLNAGGAVDTVFINETMPAQQAGYYTALAKEAGAVVKRVHSQKLRSLCQSEHHQGVVAFGASVEYKSLDEMLAIAAQRGEAPFVVLADGVEDPHNLGAIIRTAYLCGAHGIVVPKRGSAGITGTVHRASAGAASRLAVVRVANIGETMRRLKQKNVFVYCADMDGQELRRHNLTGGIALVMGSEGKGVSPLVKKLCDGVISLRMAPTGSGVDSLNVSVAAGIVMYEIMTQREQGKGAL